MIFFVLTIVVLLFLALFTLFNLHKYQKGWVILCITFFYGVWALSNFLYPRLENYELAFFFSKLIFSSTTIMTWFVLLLCLNNPVVFKYKKLGVLFLVVFGFLALLEIYVAQFTHGILLSLEYSADLGHYIFNFNIPWFLHYVLYICLILSLSIGILYYNYRNSTGRTLLQLKYLFWGFFFFFITASITNMLFPMAFGIFQYSDIGPFLATSMLMAITYGLMIDRLHDLRYLFHNILVWGIKIFIIFFSILIFLLLSIRFLYGSFPSLFDEIVIAVLGISVLIVYLTNKFNAYQILEGGKKSETFSNLENKIAVELRLENLSALILEYVKSALGVEDILILIFEKEGQRIFYRSGGGHFESPEFIEVSELLEVVDVWKSLSDEPILSKDELKRLSVDLNSPVSLKAKKVFELMEKENIEMVVPLNRKVALNGILIMGEKVDTLAFTVQDYNLLEKIIRIASVAFGRAILYQEVEEFTKTLQKKVDEQTKELRQSLQNMEEMRQREKDLVDMMGHELRTPLTIVKNSLELVEIYKKNRRKENKEIIWDGNFQKQFEYIKAAVRREMGIVETLLSATKLDAKKIEPHFSEVDLLKVIDTTLLGFEKEAAKKDLKVKIDIDKSKKWVIKVDSLQLQQVVDNIVSNAVKYTHKGHVKISLRDLGSKISVIVSDTGEGMDKASVSRLGQKFHRVKNTNGNGKNSNALVRPGGTGLGLFVAFGLVKVNGGTHDVQSQVGKGSTFTVTFKKP